MDQNCLQVSSAKTEFILIGSKQRLTKCKIDIININGDPVKLNKCKQYLGAWIDSCLSFKTHINLKYKIAWWNLQKVKLIRNMLTRETAYTIALGLIISHLDYANSLIGLPDCDIDRMQKVQNTTARLVVQDKTLTTKECLKEVHWLPVKSRIVFKVAAFMYRCLNNMAPKYLQDLIALNPIRKQGLRSNSDYKKLIVPYVSRQTFAARSFSVMGLNTWNNLPTNIRNSTSLKLFKKNLKTFLFLKAYV